MFVVGAFAALGAPVSLCAAARTRAAAQALTATVVLGVCSGRSDDVLADERRPVMRHRHWAQGPRRATPTLRALELAFARHRVRQSVAPSNAGRLGSERENARDERRVRQLAMTIDTWAGTVITQFDGDTGRSRT